MTRALLRRFLALLLCVPAISAAQSSEGSVATLHADTNLVVVDVTVTDAHQSPVHHLTAADFMVLEDGQRQNVTTFEEHSGNDVLETPQKPPSHRLEPGVFTNDPEIPETGALDVVLMDKLNTPLMDQAYAMDELARYLKSAPTGTRIAIISLTSWQLYLVQGFTSDPELLRTALSSKNASVQVSLFLHQVTSGAGYTLRLRRQLTLNALDQLARYLSGFPGRKNLIWLSASFPLSILGRSEQAEGVSLRDDEFKQTVNLLAHDQIAVYPIDVRGLVGNPYFSALNSGGSNAALSASVFGTAIDAALQKWAMLDIAEPTGGEAFVNTNDVKGAIAKATQSGSNYYTLTYSPGNRKSNGDYRRIQVQLNRPGMTLAYRRGYYAIAPSHSLAPNERRKTRVAAGNKFDSNAASYSAINAAMVRGSPEPAEIRFDVGVRPASASPETTLAPENTAEPKIRGPYRRYLVHYVAHQRDIQCPPNTRGAVACTVEFVTFVSDANEAVVNRQINRIRVTIPAAQYASMRQPGLHPRFQYQQQVSVPAKGEYYLRFGIHDVTTDHVGALEIPVAAVSGLPPVSAGSGVATSASTPSRVIDKP